jgi:hypothetical protein
MNFPEEIISIPTVLYNNEPCILEGSLCTIHNQSSNNRAGRIVRLIKIHVRWEMLNLHSIKEMLSFSFYFFFASKAFINYNLPILSMEHQFHQITNCLLKIYFS